MDLCSGCKINAESLNEHECPYQVEIHENSDFKCRCCEHCTNECAEEI